MSANERYGFRDEAISRWHRTIGQDCPAVDLDFVLVEYSNATPCALIEYKHERSQHQEHGGASIRALISLANRCDLPFFVVFYGDALNYFAVRPMNDRAKRLVRCEKSVSEDAYINFLEQLRERELRRVRQRTTPDSRVPVAQQSAGEVRRTWQDETEQDEQDEIHDLTHF